MVLHVVLIGPRCVGKTSTGTYIAEYIQADFLDGDTLAEQQERKNIENIVKEYGWEHFRVLESEIIKRVTEDYSAKDLVFAVGGGAVAHEYSELRDQNTKCLKSFGKLFLLLPSPNIDVSALVISERIKRNKTYHRPSLTGVHSEEEILRTLNERMPFYMDARDIVIYTHGLDEKATAKKIISMP